MLYNVKLSALFKVTAISDDGTELPVPNLAVLSWDWLSSEIIPSFVYNNKNGRLESDGYLFFEEENLPLGHPFGLKLEFGFSDKKLHIDGF